MRVFIFVIALLLVVGGLTYHYAALKVFNALVSKDAGTKIIAQGVSFGPDTRQRLDIYAPIGIKSRTPVILFVYGGSWSDGDRSNYEFVGRAFAANGYLTLVMDYRLHPEHKFPAFVEDVAYAISWAEHQGVSFGGDPSNIFVVGHSAGAYNATMAILDTHYLKDAGADPSAVRGVATLAGPFDFLPLDTEVTVATFGGVADLASTQPINFARSESPPFLLLSGTADTTVYPKNSRALAQRMKEVGASVETKEYKNMNHTAILTALAKPMRKESTPVLRDILAFFDNIMKEKPTQ